MFEDDDSTDDVTCCYLQLEERLRINLRDHSYCDRTSMGGKDLKILYDQQRQNHVPEQPSTSFHICDDPCIPGPSNTYISLKKKRQNGDKPACKLGNPKRTCLEEEFQQPPVSSGRKKFSSKGNTIPSKNDMNLDSEPCLASQSLLPGSTYEEHGGNSSDSSDNPWSYPTNKSAQTAKKIQKSKHPGPVTTLPGGQASSSLNAASDEDFHPKRTGALKGGRQGPDTSATKKMVLRRRVSRILESDSDSDYWRPRARSTQALVFSSSEEEDSNTDQSSKGRCSKKKPTVPSAASPRLTRQKAKSAKSPVRSLAANVTSPMRSPRLSLQLARGPYAGGSPRSNGQDMQTLLETFGIPGTGHPISPRRRTLSQRRGASPISRGSLDVAAPVPEITTIQYQSSLRDRMGEYAGTSNQCRRRGRRQSPSEFTGWNPSPRMVAGLPPDDSSEVEFFSANSYSDESNAESSLAGRSGFRSIPRSGVHSNPFANAVSSEDEISVVFATRPLTRSSHLRTGEPRRNTRTLGRRYSRSHRSLPQNPSASPDPVEQVRQMEEDERFARTLQAQFDAETDPPFLPPAASRTPDGFFGEFSGVDSSFLGHWIPVDTSLTTPAPLRLSSPPPIPSLFVPPPPVPPILVSDLRRRNAARTNGHAASSRNTRGHQRIAFLGSMPANTSFETLLGLIELSGDVPRGMQKAEIDRLPTRQFVDLSGASTSATPAPPLHKRAELNKECQVCLNDYIDGDVLRILPCFHEFHTPCIDPWLKINTTCPVCRVAVDVRG